MFERYTEKARRVIFFARYEASQTGSSHIETPHLLLGLIRESPGLINGLIAPAKCDELVTNIRNVIPVHESVSTSVDLPLNNEAKRVLAYAAEEAERLSHRHIGTEHLLLGLLREEKSPAANLLQGLGVRLSTAREAIASYSDPDLPRARQPYFPAHFADNCMEFVDHEGQRVGIGGITRAIPRAGDFIRLRRDGTEITYRVLRVTFDYHPEPPSSPHAADLLRTVQVLVTRADLKYEGGSVPVDAT